MECNLRKITRCGSLNSVSTLEIRTAGGRAQELVSLIRSSDASYVTQKQGFSTSALLMFWMDNSFGEWLSCALENVNNVSGLYSVDANSTPRPQS